MSDVIVVIGAGQIGQAIARRVSAGKLAHRRRTHGYLSRNSHSQGTRPDLHQ
jgi:predicted dinucleotide-binding enzyme